jgi:AraC family transcriptional activator FtrA
MVWRNVLVSIPRWCSRHLKGESGKIVEVRDETANASSPSKSRRATKRDLHNVAFVLYEGFAAFELGVACEIFGDDRWVAPGDPWYQLFICAENSTPVTSDGGFQILAPHGLEALKKVDTVIVAPTYRPFAVSEAVLEALRGAHARGCRMISLCGGAFVLAKAGLLSGRRTATHWADCDELAMQYPDLFVDPGVLFVDDGDILTGAGSAAGIDLCLHIVRQDYGSDLATQLARQLVVPPQRSGGQAQYIDMPLPSLDESDLLAETVEWMQSNLDLQLTVEDLASHAAMSPRTFARRFQAVTGSTPHRWMQHQRVRLAQRLLETSDLPIETVAVRSGFSTAGNLRKHFGRIVHTSPQAYRQAFRDRPTAPTRPGAREAHTPFQPTRRS